MFAIGHGAICCISCGLVARVTPWAKKITTVVVPTSYQEKMNSCPIPSSLLTLMKPNLQTEVKVPVDNNVFRSHRNIELWTRLDPPYHAVGEMYLMSPYISRIGLKSPSSIILQSLIIFSITTRRK